ncbi:unnamed protein product [Closterium sp. NIES-54]
MSPYRRPHLHFVGPGRLAMHWCSGSWALMPLFAILPRTSSPPVLFPASSLAFPLTRLAGSFTTPPRAVSSPLRTSRLLSWLPFTISSPTALPLSPPAAALPCSRSPSGRPPPPSGSCSLRCLSGRPTPRDCACRGRCRLRCC